MTESDELNRPSRADSFAPLPPDVAERWAGFPDWDETYFPTLVGLVVEDLRVDYCRMRMPHRPELDQPAGVVHGGAIATLIDTVVVPAIGTAYEAGRSFVTVTMNVQYLGAVIGEDAIAEGWVEHRTRSFAFCTVDVRTASGRPAASGTLVYKVSKARVDDGQENR